MKLITSPKIKLIMSIVAPVLLLMATASLIVVAWYVSVIQTGDLDATTKNLVVEYIFDNSKKSNESTYNISDIAFFDKNQEQELKYIKDMAIRLQIKLKNNSDNKIDYKVEFVSEKNIIYKNVTNEALNQDSTYYINYGKASGKYLTGYFTKSSNLGYLEAKVSQDEYNNNYYSKTYYIKNADNSYSKAQSAFNPGTTYYIKGNNDTYPQADNLNESTYNASFESIKYYTKNNDTYSLSTAIYNSNTQYYVQSYYAKATPTETEYYNALNSTLYYVDNNSTKQLSTGKFDDTGETNYYTKDNNDVYTLVAITEDEYYDSTISTIYYQYDDIKKFKEEKINNEYQHNEYEEYYVATSIAYIDCIYETDAIKGEKYIKVDNLTEAKFNQNKTNYYTESEGVYTQVLANATYSEETSYYVREPILNPRVNDKKVIDLQFNTDDPLITYTYKDNEVNVIREGELNVNPSKASYVTPTSSSTTPTTSTTATPVVDESYTIFNLYIFGVQEIPTAKNTDFIYDIENDEIIYKSYNFKLIFTASPLGEVIIDENTETTPTTSSTTPTTSTTTTTN